MRWVWRLCAGLLLGALAGCGEKQLCLTAADCDEWMRCTAGGVCTPESERETTTARERQNAPPRGAPGVEVFMQDVEQLQAWLSGRFGEDEIAVNATVEAYGAAPSPTLADAFGLTFTGHERNSGLVMFTLPLALRDIPPDTPIRITNVVVCGGGDGTGWAYDDQDGDGTVLLTPDGSGGAMLEARVRHGATVEQTALARVQLPPF